MSLNKYDPVWESSEVSVPKAPTEIEHVPCACSDCLGTRAAWHTLFLIVGWFNFISGALGLFYSLDRGRSYMIAGSIVSMLFGAVGLWLGSERKKRDS